MFNAKEARNTSESNKKTTADLDNLTNHFEQLIRKAVNLGKFSLEKVVFPEDRFKSEVVEEVVNNLKAGGYKVSTTKNNAHQQITFEISW